MGCYNRGDFQKSLEWLDKSVTLVLRPEIVGTHGTDFPVLLIDHGTAIVDEACTGRNDLDKELEVLDKLVEVDTKFNPSIDKEKLSYLHHVRGNVLAAQDGSK